MAGNPGSTSSIGAAHRISRGQRDLIVALLAGAAVFGIDRMTGRHLEGALAAFSRRLAAWYEDKRQPAVTCIPSKAVPYDADPAATWSVPECWQAQAETLLNRTVHVFRDPDARAGTVSVIVEPIESGEDAESLKAEFATLAALPGAVVDGAKQDESAEGPGVSRESWRQAGSGGLAERIAHEAESTGRGEEGKAAAAPLTATTAAPVTATTAVPPESGSPQHRLIARTGSTEAARPSNSAASPFHRVEVGGLLGPTAASEETPVSLDQENQRDLEGRYSRSSWTFLLLGDSCAVRVTYLVRAGWIGSSVVAEEFARVRALVDSVRPRPRSQPQGQG